MIEKLSNWIETERIHMIKLPETVTEFTNFTYDISETTDRIRYEAPVGFHDDIVIAHALAVWRLNPLVREAQQAPKTIIRLSYEQKLKDQTQEANLEVPESNWEQWAES